MLLNGNYLLRQGILFFIGASAGGVIAAGVFAFLAMIGVFPRLIGKSNTRRHIILYESLIVFGGITGNLVDLYEPQIHWGGAPVLCLFGFFVGVFIACLVMSLAEMLKAIPIFNRRIHLAVGIQYVVFSIAGGKLIGSLIYFYRGIGS